VEVVLLLQEVAPEITKLSARSKSGYNVAALAQRFGGGGHRRAAGATMHGPLAGTRQQLLDAALAEFERGGKLE
jgi:phosphoesterase RecJ-like protein